MELRGLVPRHDPAIRRWSRRVTQPWGDVSDVGVGVVGGEYGDGAAHAVDDDGPDVGVGDVLAAAERGEMARREGIVHGVTGCALCDERPA